MPAETAGLEAPAVVDECLERDGPASDDLPCDADASSSLAALRCEAIMLPSFEIWCNPGARYVMLIGCYDNECAILSVLRESR